MAQVTAAREALDEEEQRLLEEVQREEERVEQCLLTQRVHWEQALANLSQTRSSLVHMLTHTPDTHLAVSSGFSHWGWGRLVKLMVGGGGSIGRKFERRGNGILRNGHK